MHAESNYALKKWKSHLPSYLGNEGSYQKTVKGVLPLIYHAESRYALKKRKGHLPSYLSNVALHMSATCRYMCKVSKLGHALTLEPFELERHVNQVQTVRKV